MLRLSYSAFAAALLMSALVSSKSARADEYVGSLKDSPPPPNEYVWDGLYVGAGIGVGSFNHNVNVNQGNHGDGDNECFECSEIYRVQQQMGFGTQSFSDDDWNVFGTLQIGYDRVLGNRFLIGAFLDFDFYPDADSSFSSAPIKKPGDMNYVPVLNGPGSSVSGKVSLEHAWYAGARIGVLLRPDFLLFASGGYTEASLDGSINLGGPMIMPAFDMMMPSPPHGATLSAPDELHGWFIGVGGERKLDSNLSLKIEYRYARYQGESFSSSHHNGYEVSALDGYGPGMSADIDADIHTVRAALVFKLNDCERDAVPLK
ncbi:MAG: outer membrane protein [Hyphomicrobium sp.]